MWCDSKMALVLITFGLATYEERLRHLKLTHIGSTLNLHTSGGNAPGFKGLVIRDQSTGEHFLKEVHRAGNVQMLEPLACKSSK